MKDVLEVARERQTELSAEIAEIDEFIRMAESLLRTTRSGDRQRVVQSADDMDSETPAPAERTGGAKLFRKPSPPTDDAEADEEPLRLDNPQIVDLPDAESEPSAEPAARSFPWSNTQPPARKTEGGEEGGRTRHNLMRREAG